MTDKHPTTRKFESACPKCHLRLTIELDIEPSAERGVVVTCDHCGVTKRLSAFHRELARQIRENEKRKVRSAERQERLEFDRKQAQDVASAIEQLHTRSAVVQTTPEPHPPRADVGGAAPAAATSTPVKPSKRSRNRTKIIVAVANAVIVAIAGIIYVLVYYGPPPHNAELTKQNAELTQQNAAYRDAIMRAAFANAQTSRADADTLDRAVDLVAAVVDRGKVTAQYACQGIGDSLDYIADNPQWTPEYLEEILLLGKVLELSLEAQAEKIQNPDAALIAAVKKAPWFRTVARACRNEQPHELAKLIATYMLCKKHGRKLRAIEDTIEANFSGGDAACARACLKHAWEDRSISR